MTKPPSREQAGAPTPPSRALLRFFDLYLFLFMRRHFHALRLAHPERWPRANRPLLVCLNHPSWWDPLICIVLSRFLERGANHYAPMDEAAFTRYGVLRKLGLFPVEQGTPRGAAQFLRSASQIFKDGHGVLWITPQGGFTDARARPAVFRAGVDALLRRTEQITVLPLALEYTFWDERLPEALGMLGEPLVFRRGENASGTTVAAALERTQDELARISARRDPAQFTTVLAGAGGISGIYGGWQRFAARLRGKRFGAEHGSLRSLDKSE